MKIIFTILRIFQDYEYKEDSNTTIYGSYENLKDAQKALVGVVKSYYDEDYSSLTDCWRSEDCFIDERDYSYTEFNIVENRLN